MYAISTQSLWVNAGIELQNISKHPHIFLPFYCTYSFFFLVRFKFLTLMTVGVMPTLQIKYLIHILSRLQHVLSCICPLYNYRFLMPPSHSTNSPILDAPSLRQNKIFHIQLSLLLSKGGNMFLWNFGIHLSNYIHSITYHKTVTFIISSYLMLNNLEFDTILLINLCPCQSDLKVYFST